MAQIRLSIATVNITNDLIVIARKTTTPLVTEAQEVYNAPHPTTRNIVLPASGDIDPVIYYVDFYESSDGVSLDLLLSSFQYDLKNNIIISERRFYTVGGGNPTDPAPDQKILSDPYLDGKTISGVFKEGYRYLKPNTEGLPEWDPYTGGGIELRDPYIFSNGEVYIIEISYLVNQSQASGSGGLYTGVELIDASTTLNSGHRNKRLRCEASANNVLVVNLESLSAVPDGTYYHFTSNGGLQNQTRILPDGSDTIKYNGENYTEISFGKGEYIRIVKTGSFWEAELTHPFVLQVGERFSATLKDHPSCKPEDGELYDGDEWPRPWWWINNKLPSTHYIVDDNVIDPGYTHPADKPGLFVKHSTLKKFRMPNTQGLSERGLELFNTYGTNYDRDYDYPGGYQGDQVGEFDLILNSAPIFRKSGTNNTIVGLGTGGSNPDPAVATITVVYPNINSGDENIVENFGVVYMRRF